MCGIAGICDTENEAVDPGLLRAMTETLAHRGPDDEGYVLFGRGRRLEMDRDSIRETRSPFSLGFGHRRLSIIDLSSAGHQPMTNEDRTVWITYNGEI